MEWWNGWFIFNNFVYDKVNEFYERVFGNSFIE